VSRRVLAIGDIHGCDTALETLLGQLQIEADDTVVLLGDIVDRGPGTRQVIERLMDLQSHCQLYFVQGNHEQMLLHAMESPTTRARWMAFGGLDVLKSYSVAGEIDSIPESHLNFLRATVDYYETPTEVFVHASLEPGVPLSRQHDEWLRWTRFSGREEPLETGQRVVCGHTAQKSGLPLAIRGWVCIDTYVYGDGWLTCLDVQTDEFFQANQLGQYRTGQLTG